MVVVVGKKHKNKHKNKEKSEEKQPKEGKERGRDADKHKEKKEKRRDRSESSHKAKRSVTSEERSGSVSSPSRCATPPPPPSRKKSASPKTFSHKASPPPRQASAKSQCGDLLSDELIKTCLFFLPLSRSPQVSNSSPPSAEPQQRRPAPLPLLSLWLLCPSPLFVATTPAPLVLLRA